MTGTTQCRRCGSTLFDPEEQERRECDTCATLVYAVDLGDELGTDRYQGVPWNEEGTGPEVGTEAGEQAPCCGMGTITVVRSDQPFARCDHPSCRAEYGVVRQPAWNVVGPDV